MWANLVQGHGTVRNWHLIAMASERAMAKFDIDPTEFDVAVGAVLRSQRKKAGLEAKLVAEAIGAKVEQISRYEAGTNKVSVMRLCQLANVFDVPPSALMLEIEVRVSQGAKLSRSDSFRKNQRT